MQSKLWIDGVGVWLLSSGGRFTIGGPALGSESADLALLANLSRQHAVIARNAEGYTFETTGESHVDGRPVRERTNLTRDCEIRLGENVRLGFRLPTALSNTATLDFVSDHRPAQHADGVVLMAETCLLGPGRENHIRCPGWPDAVVLYRREGELWCRGRGELSIDGKPATGGGVVAEGTTVAGDGFRFRMEGAGGQSVVSG